MVKGFTICKERFDTVVDDMKDCSQWDERFTARIVHKHKSNDEVSLIFDRYDLPLCLRTATVEPI